MALYSDEENSVNYIDKWFILAIAVKVIVKLMDWSLSKYIESILSPTKHQQQSSAKRDLSMPLKASVRKFPFEKIL